MLLESGAVGRLLEVLSTGFADDGFGGRVGLELRRWRFGVVFGIIALALRLCFGTVAHFFFLWAEDFLGWNWERNAFRGYSLPRVECVEICRAVPNCRLYRKGLEEGGCGTRRKEKIFLFTAWLGLCTFVRSGFFWSRHTPRLGNQEPVVVVETAQGRLLTHLFCVLRSAFCILRQIPLFVPLSEEISRVGQRQEAAFLAIPVRLCSVL
jgi:hypothetical protein